MRIRLGAISEIRTGPGWLLFTIGVVLLATVGCHRKEEQRGAPPPPEVSVATVQSKSVTLTTELPGRIDPVRVAEVRARVTGIVLKRTFEEGASVREGDVLFQIDPAPFQAAVDSARAMVSRAEAVLSQTTSKAERFNLLVQSNAVSRQEYEDTTAAAKQAQADLEASKAALQTAELSLGYASVTAPISGRIGAARVTEGALVSQASATLMATIQQLDPIYFDFTQSSTEVLRLRRQVEAGKLKVAAPGQARVLLLLEDGTVYSEPGRLLFLDVSVDPTTGMVTLRAEFPNPKHFLLPGMFARGRFEQAVDEQAVTITQRAVQRGPNGAATVLVVNNENKVESRPVQTGEAINDEWIISSGLKPGERVIVAGTLKARPGQEVKPVPFVPEGVSTNQPATNQTAVPSAPTR